MKEEKKYSMLQLPSDIHKLLKDYCDERGYKMGGLVSNLIKKHIKK